MYHIGTIIRGLYKTKTPWGPFWLSFETTKKSIVDLCTFSTVHVIKQSCSFGLNTNPNQLPPNASQTRREHKFK